VQGQLAQIETLVEGMLSYIKGDISAAGSFSPVRLLEEVRQATAMQVEAEGGQLRFEFSGQDGEVQGDREALFNALSNLVVNAIQASERAPDIRVEAFAGPELLRFRVTDSGPGIDEKTRDRIFDPFFSTRPGGTGLGLAVVMSAVRAHRGEMGVRTRPEGGAEFTMTIPRSPVSPGV
jgi:two-component system sensor histidine kinase FlrB